MLNRRQFLAASAAPLAFRAKAATAPRRNVLFIAIDDLNDWIGCLGGHPQAKTPNLDRLASQGVLFSNAHCAAPLCNPSRASVMTSVRPSTSGVYDNNQPFRLSTVTKDTVTLPQLLKQHGYRALGAGKIYHSEFPDPESWDEYWPSLRQTKPGSPLLEPLPANGVPGSGNFDWGALPNPDEEMGDYQVVSWVADQLAKKRNDPMFLACGIYRPHLPWFVPKKYFDLFPLSTIQLPEVNEQDLDDVPPMAKEIALRQKDHERITGANKWKEAVQAYLASIAFADAQVGRVMRALEESPQAKDYDVVLWSDHGWHLGEKLHWRKFSLWEESTRNVLMVRAAGAKSGERCKRPVSLLDIYPTLAELQGIAKPKHVEGQSLTPLLKNPNAERHAPVLTTFGYKNHSLRDERWRYTTYEDGTEELYDHAADPREWKNLASQPEHTQTKQRLAAFFPKRNVAPSPKGKGNGNESDFGSRLP